MKNQLLRDRIYRGVFFLAVGFLYIAIFLRSYLQYQNTPYLGQILGVLLLFMVFFLIETAFVNHSTRFFYIYLALQTILVCLLIYGPDYKEYDFFSLLFTILGMQALQHLNLRIAVGWILFTLFLIGIPFIYFQGFLQGLILLLLFGSVIIFMSAYSLAIRRAQDAHQHNRILLTQLQEANLQLERHSDTLRQLGVARERQRLRRELHDSVTQTIFSMTLTTQSALLLLDRDPTRVGAQLERLSVLTQSALAEMHTLISELRTDQLTSSGLKAELSKHIESRHFPEGLSVSLEVEGGQTLSTNEDLGLFRIAQEALNNVVKHAHATEACIRLHLADPCWLKIEDNGKGFNLVQSHEIGQMGLAGMRERADEIDWSLMIDSTPGRGTHILVEKNYPTEKRE